MRSPTPQIIRESRPWLFITPEAFEALSLMLIVPGAFAFAAQFYLVRSELAVPQALTLTRVAIPIVSPEGPVVAPVAAGPVEATALREMPAPTKVAAITPPIKKIKPRPPTRMPAATKRVRSTPVRKRLPRASAVSDIEAAARAANSDYLSEAKRVREKTEEE